MNAHWWWWGLAVVLTVLELTTGTLYLLVLAIGAVAAGLGAWFGLGSVAQILVAAVVSLIAWLVLRRWQPLRSRKPVQSNQDVLLDIGSRVKVERWQAGGVSRVHYRGASWEAVIIPGLASPPEPGEFEIRAIEGNRLVLAPAA